MRSFARNRRAAVNIDPDGVAAVAAALVEWRAEQRLTQMDIATVLDIGLSSYSNYERGRAAIPAYMVRRLAERFGSTGDRLLGLHLPGDGEGDAA